MRTGSVIKLTKEDIKDLIDEHPTLGQRIVYSNKFVPNVVKAFRQIDNKPHDETQTVEDISYLCQKAPEGYLSANGLAEKWGVNRGTVSGVISSLKDQLGAIENYRFGIGSHAAYSSEQQQMIFNYLIGKDTFVPQAPEGYLAANGVAKEWGISEWICY